MNIFIKNMVCTRCVMVVAQEFAKAGLDPIEVLMGEVKLSNPLTDHQFQEINHRLTALGFELLDDKAQKVIEKVKSLVIQKVQSGAIEEHFILSEFLVQELGRRHTQVSRLFSEVEGVTLEQFFILQRLEKVKEWLVYGELTLSEIAWKLGYSSVAHLSSQFKKITGFTPSHFKKLGNRNRKPLDKI